MACVFPCDQPIGTGCLQPDNYHTATERSQLRKAGYFAGTLSGVRVLGLYNLSGRLVWHVSMVACRACLRSCQQRSPLLSTGLQFSFQLALNQRVHANMLPGANRLISRSTEGSTMLLHMHHTVCVLPCHLCACRCKVPNRLGLTPSCCCVNCVVLVLSCCMHCTCACTWQNASHAQPHGCQVVDLHPYTLKELLTTLKAASGATLSY